MCSLVVSLGLADHFSMISTLSYASCNIHNALLHSPAKKTVRVFEYKLMRKMQLITYTYSAEICKIQRK